MAKGTAKVKVKQKSKPKAQTAPKLIGKTKVRTTAHLLINKDGKPRRKGW